MRKSLNFMMTTISFSFILLLFGVGFSTWHFMQSTNEVKRANISVSSYIDFSGLTFSDITYPKVIAFEDPLSSMAISSTGIYFLKESDSVLNEMNLHTSTSANCSDVFSFNLIKSADFSNKSDIVATDIKVYLGVKVDADVANYFNFNGYLYDSTNYGKEISMTLSNDIFTSKVHLNEIILYQDAETTFGNLTSFISFANAVQNATFEFIITVKEA